MVYSNRSTLLISGCHLYYIWCIIDIDFERYGIYMECKDFQSKINDFIDGNMDIEHVDEFLEHLHSCNECYEELEIRFLVQTGLDELDNDDISAYDLKGKLNKLIYDYEAESYRNIRVEFFKKLIFVLADGVTLGSMIYCALRWIDIV